MAFVLAGSSADFTTGTGYAVAYGNSSAPDSLRLVRYTAGLTGPATLRTLVAVSIPAGPAAPVCVLYAPDEDNWTLEVGPSTSAFTDPLTTTYTRIGIRKDTVTRRRPYLTWARSGTTPPRPASTPYSITSTPRPLARWAAGNASGGPARAGPCVGVGAKLPAGLGISVRAYRGRTTLNKERSYFDGEHQRQSLQASLTYQLPAHQ